MSSCGLLHFSSCTKKGRKKVKTKENAVSLLTSLDSSSGNGSSISRNSSISSISSINSNDGNFNRFNSQTNPFKQREKWEFPLEFTWARDDQLSTIVESLEESRKASIVSSDKNTIPTPSLSPSLSPSPPSRIPPQIPRKPVPFQSARHQRPANIVAGPKRQKVPILKSHIMSERKSSSSSPRMIPPAPRDLDTISRIDASLVFEHFTTADAWDLGSSLRERLMSIPTPVVINISLANQNQTIFHSVTHSGVMPDNESWVERKRRTVLRWGCSTWFMACKFAGDERAFREKYALGNNAGDYAIHGGGVPIRVTGVEGVVAVVVVSGLKEDEDHAVIVEVIKELYY